jgi:HEAT repeat protein
VKSEKEHNVERWDDCDLTVRANACTLIGNIGAEVTVDRFRELSDNDPDERLREQAEWALEKFSRNRYKILW